MCERATGFNGLGLLDITQHHHTRTTPINQALTQPPAPPVEIELGVEGDAIALALSGGGARAASFSLGVLLQLRDMKGPDGRALAAGVAEKVDALKQAGADWLYLGPDTFLFSQMNTVAQAALAARLPTFSATEAVLDLKAPVLTGLVSSYYTLGQFAGYKAEQILVKKQRARDIPIETLSRYSFIVRMEVAKQLDLLPPVSLFNYAVMR